MDSASHLAVCRCKLRMIESTVLLRTLLIVSVFGAELDFSCIICNFYKTIKEVVPGNHSTFNGLKLFAPISLYSLLKA